jgi:hypothetical protein
MRAATLYTLAFVLALPLASYAQGTGPDEITRQAYRGNVGPWEGASYHERYHYGAVQPLYGIWNSRNFYDLEYLDRLDRLEKFGHRWPSAKYGSEFQYGRIENEYQKRNEQLDHPRVRASVGGGFLFGRSRWR